jgi:hypothetical protein
MKLTKNQLKKMIQEESVKILGEGALEEVGGNQPVFHDAAMDQALNGYVDQYVMRLEEDIGESRSTLMLLETMKGYLVEAIQKATDDAKADSGVKY